MSDTSFERLMHAISFKDDHKYVLITEEGLIDSHFVISHLIKTILDKNKKICLVLLHNTIGHFHNISKKLNHNLMERVNLGDIKLIEPMTQIFKELTLSDQKIMFTKDLDAKQLIDNLKELIVNNIPDTDDCYLIFDDLSHLVELGVDHNLIARFMSMLAEELEPKNVRFVVNTHVGNEDDEMLAQILRYNSDLFMSVQPLRTGRSHDVTGVINIFPRNDGVEQTYHFKSYDKEVRTFKPGESILRLYK